jgi:hypothetical protein
MIAARAVQERPMPCPFRAVACTLLVAVVLCFAAVPLARAAHDGDSDDHVGDVHFPTSCSPASQPALNKGLALLHSFQYQESSQAFGEAVQRDTRCSMAYWGKAMSLYHQLWEFPDASQIAQGRQDIEQAENAGAPTPREREYIAAAAAFYQDSTTLSHTARTQAYSLAMQKLFADNPNDVEAGALYALSLVSLAQDGVDDLPNRRKAIAILNPLFAEQPNNPGLAHYLIHASDVPELAAEGLPAARAYAKIAPDSSHATHMPSHIFRRLGLWQEMIDSNLAAIAAAAEATQAGRGDASYQFHPMDFLDYAYLQSGQQSKARQLVGACATVPGAKAEEIADHQAMFEARNAIELHQWKEAAALPIRHQQFIWQDVTYWARAIGAARTGDVAGAQQDAHTLAEIVKAQNDHNKEMGNEVTPGEGVEEREANAWIAFAEGKTDQAIAGLRAAAEREESGREDPFAGPAREMLADMLVELNQPKQALVEYQAVLQDYPNRFDALYGAARSAEAASDGEQAQRFYAQLLKISLPGADRPELQSAKTFSSRHS